MKDRIRKKFIASIILTAFTVMNTMPIACALGEYRPNIRSNAAATALDVNTGVKINNANSIVNLSLRDADITQVLRMFADQAGMNIIFTPNVKGEVTMDLVNIELEKALNLVVNVSNLYYNIKDNTIVVASSTEELQTVSGESNMVMIPVKYVSAKSIATFLNKNIFTNQSGVAKPGISTKPVVSVNPAANELIVMGTRNDAILAQRIVDQFDKKPSITNFKVNHVTPAEMADLICGTLIPSVMSDGGKSTGGAAGVPTGFASDSSSKSKSSSSSSSSSSSGSSDDNISVGGGTLACSVEQKVSEDGMESPAFKNMTVAYFPSLGTVQVIGGSQTQLEMIRDYITASDKKSPQAYLDVQMVSLNEEGSKQFQNEWSFLSKSFSFNAGGGTFVPFNSKDQNIIIGSRGSDQFWTNSPRLVYNVKYSLSNGKGRVLSNPKVLVTSGQESTIELTSDYISKVTTQYLDNGSSTAAQVQKDYDIASDNGITLTITPFISPDGYVTLDLEPEFNEIKETVLDTTTGDVAATLLSRTNMELKSVRIKDDETLVLGGLIRESETKTVSKIPFLGDIPVLGMFFRTTNTGRKKEEIVIMITPHIVVDTEDAAGEFAL